VNFDRPKSLGKSIEVRASNRPVKVAYLVDRSQNNIAIIRS
jgi:hypothetical protein